MSSKLVGELIAEIEQGDFTALLGLLDYLEETRDARWLTVNRQVGYLLNGVHPHGAGQTQQLRVWNYFVSSMRELFWAERHPGGRLAAIQEYQKKLTVLQAQDAKDTAEVREFLRTEFQPTLPAPGKLQELRGLLGYGLYEEIPGDQEDRTEESILDDMTTLVRNIGMDLTRLREYLANTPPAGDEGYGGEAPVDPHYYATPLPLPLNGQDE